MSTTETLSPQGAADAADFAKALVNILSDVDDEQQRQGESQRAILNILADLDIEKTRLESTQRALINMLDDLESERRKVDQTNMELQEVNEAMRNFIATAAHDLRSPLASMVGFSSLLAKNWATLSEEKRLKFVTTIDRQTHKLTWLVNDLLTLSSIEGGALNTQPELVVVTEAITQCLAASGRDTTSVSVTCSPDLVVRVDPLHLGRMIDNYLQNAVKYGEPPVRIEAAPRGDMVEIRVVDHGPGVPPEFEPKLFAKFARADIPSMRDKKGTGLGLSIVRGLAEANGGQADYQRNVPQGSCFLVLLPTNERPRR
ncbi:MAG TPA: ATP-binding protein [Dermatophilaceae bacterium]|nr:ATP-binding protein [Dermatophilaceae bacterium]